MWLICLLELDRIRGSSSPSTSRMRLPLSVVKCSRSCGRAAELDELARDVAARHRDHLDRQRELAEHADQLRRVDDAHELSPTAATIFSRVSAPPPPLIIAPCSVTSSAPSM